MNKNNLVAQRILSLIDSKWKLFLKSEFESDYMRSLSNFLAERTKLKSFCSAKRSTFPFELKVKEHRCGKAQRIHAV